MTSNIINSINKTITPVRELNSLPDEQGIYAFYINDTIDLGKFGKPGPFQNKLETLCCVKFSAY